MAIEMNYVNKITEIEAVPEGLTPFETKFIFGDEQGSPIRERPSLSDKQKAMIDRIYKERVQQMSREDAAVIDFGNKRVSAVQEGGNTTYRTVIDNVQVGPIINFGEATNIVSWLSAALTDKHIVLSVPTVGGTEDTGGFPGE